MNAVMNAVMKLVALTAVYTVLEAVIPDGTLKKSAIRCMGFLCMLMTVELITEVFI